MCPFRYESVEIASGDTDAPSRVLFTLRPRLDIYCSKNDGNYFHVELPREKLYSRALSKTDTDHSR